jgi:hypothetical protein
LGWNRGKVQKYYVSTLITQIHTRVFRRRSQMKYRVLIPDKPKVRNMVCCLQSLLSQMDHVENLNKAVTGIRINKQTRAIEIEVEDEPDEKLL